MGITPCLTATYLRKTVLLGKMAPFFSLYSKALAGAEVTSRVLWDAVSSIYRPIFSAAGNTRIALHSV